MWIMKRKINTYPQANFIDTHVLYVNIFVGQIDLYWIFFYGFGTTYNSEFPSKFANWNSLGENWILIYFSYKCFTYSFKLCHFWTCLLLLINRQLPNSRTLYAPSYICKACTMEQYKNCRVENINIVFPNQPRILLTSSLVINYPLIFVQRHLWLSCIQQNLLIPSFAHYKVAPFQFSPISSKLRLY